MVNVKLTAEEFRVLTVYQSLNPEDRQAIRIILDSFLKAQQEEQRTDVIIPFPMTTRV